MNRPQHEKDDAIQHKEDDTMKSSNPSPETPVPDYETWMAEHDLFGRMSAELGIDREEAEFAAICTLEADGDESLAIDLALQPILMSVAAEDAGAPAEYHDPATWRRLAVAEHHASMAKLTAPRPKATPKRTAPRARTQRSARRGTTHSTQSPGDDGDPDPDPIELRIRELVDQAPPLSIGQQRRLRALLGGGAR